MLACVETIIGGEALEAKPNDTIIADALFKIGNDVNDMANKLDHMALEVWRGDEMANLNIKKRYRTMINVVIHVIP